MTLPLAFRAATPTDIPALRDLADRVWRVSYAAMLSPAQIDYMLEWMYGAGTIAAELSRGVVWEIADHAGMPVGYIAIAIAIAGTTAELNKLYLLPEHQGRGWGQVMLARVERAARDRGCTVLRLRVNKTNDRALRAYNRAGFAIVDALVADIGNGFVMDDYVLAKTLG